MGYALAAVKDFFFAARINEVAKATGAKVLFVQSKSEVIDHAERKQPSLVIVDLNFTQFEPLQTIHDLKHSQLQDIPMVGFLNHVQKDLEAKATAAGIDRVLTNAVFTQELPQLLMNVKRE